MSEITSGPHEPTPTIRWCDAGMHSLAGDELWWLVQDSTRGWLESKGTSCERHLTRYQGQNQVGSGG